MVLGRAPARLTLRDRSRPVIVGAQDDLHVQAVARGLADPVLIDVNTLRQGRLAVRNNGLLEVTSEGWKPVAPTGRGWIRRFAPAGWTEGTRAHSQHAIEQAAWLSMLVSYVRVGGISWMTSIDDMLAAENKMRLAQIATTVGAPCPPTVLATSPNAAAAILGTDQLVAKPIGPGSFLRGDEYLSIPTSDVSKLIDTPLAHEPYLYQQYVRSSRHIRVVTVRKRSWCFSRAVHDNEPLDWRYLETAHDEFRLEKSDDIERLAVALASALHVGYSSQDWIDDGNTSWVVDVNPAGQWLFLEDAAEEISAAFSSWLQGDQP